MHKFCCCCETGGNGTGSGQGSGEGNKPPWNVPPLGTWLFISFDAADMGGRPVPSGDVFWESADIWLTGGDKDGNPIGGKPATIFARVWNIGGLDAAPVRVDFSFIAPSLGIMPESPKLIGTGWSFVPTLRAQVVSCPIPWIPPLDIQNIHACLIVTCSAPLQGDVPSQSGNVVADRHTAQKNLTIIEASAGQSLHFALQVANLAPTVKTVDLMAAAVWRTTQKLHVGDFQLAPSLTAALGAINRAVPVDDVRLWSKRAAIMDERTNSHDLVQLPERGVLDAIQVTRVGHPRTIDNAVTFVGPRDRPSSPKTAFVGLGNSLRLEARQQVTVHMEVTVPCGGAGPWLLLHIAQASDGLLTGGYSIALRVDSSRTVSPETPFLPGDAMQNEKIPHDPHLDRLLVKSDPTTRLVADIANRLLHHLPIINTADLKSALDKYGSIKIGSNKFALTQLSALVPEAIFPITDVEDLVRKLRAGVGAWLKIG